MVPRNDVTRGCGITAIPIAPKARAASSEKRQARPSRRRALGKEKARHVANRAGPSLEAGVHPKVAQERLGRSTITTTLDLYSHVTDTMQEDAALRLDRVLGDAIRGRSGKSGGSR